MNHYKKRHDAIRTIEKLIADLDRPDISCNEFWNTCERIKGAVAEAQHANENCRQYSILRGRMDVV